MSIRKWYKGASGAIALALSTAVVLPARGDDASDATNEADVAASKEAEQQTEADISGMEARLTQLGSKANELRVDAARAEAASVAAQQRLSTSIEEAMDAQDAVETADKRVGAARKQLSKMSTSIYKHGAGAVSGGNIGLGVDGYRLANEKARAYRVLAKKSNRDLTRFKTARSTAATLQKKAEEKASSEKNVAQEAVDASAKAATAASSAQAQILRISKERDRLISKLASQKGTTAELVREQQDQKEAAAKAKADEESRKIVSDAREQAMQTVEREASAKASAAPSTDEIIDAGAGASEAQSSDTAADARGSGQQNGGSVVNAGASGTQNGGSVVKNSDSAAAADGSAQSMDPGAGSGERVAESGERTAVGAGASASPVPSAGSHSLAGLEATAGSRPSSTVKAGPASASTSRAAERQVEAQKQAQRAADQRAAAQMKVQQAAAQKQAQRAAAQQAARQRAAAQRQAQAAVRQQASQQAAQQRAAQQAAKQKQVQQVAAQRQGQQAAASGSGVGSQIVAYARQFAGVRYVWGGTNPSSGWDCVGFTHYVYAHFGRETPRRTGGRLGQFWGGYKVVPASQRQPGDLMWWPGHTGIYTGNNMHIAAWNPSMGTQERKVWGSPVYLRIVG